MGIGINTNIVGLRAQFALSHTNKNFNTALMRLSTGLRINTPADDVVGLATSTNLMTQIRGLQQARLNINSAMGLLNVAEGYLSQLTEVAQELRAVAVQAAEDSLSSSVRGTLESRFDSLRNEYDRLTDNADFNGVTILGSGAYGTGLSSVIQVGPDANETLTVSIADTRIEAIGRVAVYTAQTRTATSASATAEAAFAGPNAGITINDVAVPIADFTTDGVSNVGSSESAIAYTRAINSVSQTSGVRATVVANVFTINYDAGAGLESNQHLVLNGVTVKATDMAVAAGDDDGVSTLVSLINDYSSDTGVTASIDTTSNKILLTATDGRNIHLQLSAAGAVSGSYNVFGVTGAVGNTQVAQRGTFRLEADEAFDIVGAQNEFTSAATESVAMDEYGDNAAGTTTLSEANVATASTAGYAITIMENVINQLQTRRADVGSLLNRFEVAEQEMGVRIENLEDSNSMIRDSDLAEETANLTKFQVMQRAGMAVLSQANTAPAMALELLRKM
ncbi:MAG: hypothetical protein HQM16_03365 [Deltaproteobacteria bacterium]|nr:hypothetical protein [Deltaproteobacteria bacterium]